MVLCLQRFGTGNSEKKTFQDTLKVRLLKMGLLGKSCEYFHWNLLWQLQCYLILEHYKKKEEVIYKNWRILFLLTIAVFMVSFLLKSQWLGISLSLILGAHAIYLLLRFPKV